MAKVEWSPRALEDFRAQLEWLAARSPAAAERLATDVTRTVGLLAAQPGLGRWVAGRTYRVMLTRRSRHRIAYRATTTGVEVLRVLHSAQSGP